MPRPLPAALAAALARAKAQHAGGAAPTIPFVPETRLDPRQAEAFGAPPASLLDWKTWEVQLLGHAGAALPYLGFGHDELRDEAQRIPEGIPLRRLHAIRRTWPRHAHATQMQWLTMHVDSLPSTLTL